MGWLLAWMPQWVWTEPLQAPGCWTLPSKENRTIPTFGDDDDPTDCIRVIVEAAVRDSTQMSAILSSTAMAALEESLGVKDAKRSQLAAWPVPPEASGCRPPSR